MKKLLIFIVVFFLHPCYAKADWPTGGYNFQRTFHSSETIPVGNYSEIWEYTPPTGYYANVTPAIQNGKVITGIYKSGTPYSSARYICLNEQTGAVEWESPGLGYWIAGEVTMDNDKLYGTAGAQLVNGQFRQYASLFCLNSSTGQILWQTGPTWSGWNSAPAIEGNNLFAIRMSYSDISPSRYYLNCFDKNTGVIKWVKEVGISITYLPYIVVSNGRIFVCSSKVGGGIYAYDLNGNILWHQNRDWIAASGICTNYDPDKEPLGETDQEIVFAVIPAGYQNNACIINAINANTGVTLWEKTFDSSYDTPSNPAFANNKLYVSYKGKIHVYDASTGQEFPSTMNGGTWKLTIINGKIFYGSTNGNIYALDINTGEILLAYYLGGGTNRAGTPVVISGKRVLATSYGSLKCIGNPNTPPAVSAGNNLNIASSDQLTTIIRGIASDTDGDALMYRWLEDNTVLQNRSPASAEGFCDLNLANLSPLSLGSHTLTLEVDDGKETVWSSMMLTVDNSVSVIALKGTGSYQIAEPVTIGADVSDYDGDTLNYKWYLNAVVQVEGIVATIYGGTPVSVPDVSFPVGLSLGEHVIMLEVSDGVTTVSQSIIVQIVDTEAPTLKPVSNVYMLWPPNHQMVEVVINANAADNSGQLTLMATVSCNESLNSKGDGDTDIDYIEPVVNNTTGIITLQLRAERCGKGAGRTYTVTVFATDIAKNTTKAEVKIVAPHDKGE